MIFAKVLKNTSKREIPVDQIAIALIMNLPIA
jgi:bifunctional DNase/RNase